jgi:hypothetical protein
MLIMHSHENHAVADWTMRSVCLIADSEMAANYGSLGISNEMFSFQNL